MKDGLEGVIAAWTILSDVDGTAGRLVIRGHHVEALSGQRRFEDVAHLLWDELIDDLPEPDIFQTRLGKARVEAFARMSRSGDAFRSSNALDAVRAMVAQLPDGDDLETALLILASASVCTAAVGRARHGLEPVEPDSALDHASDTLRMMRGRSASQVESEALDAYLVTVSDHGLNASTFAARITASTLAGLTSAVLAGISALKGPRHGGAPGPVIDMLDAIGGSENARPWIETALARGDRLMGFGHRIYRVRDPRADALKRVLQTLPTGSGRLALAEAVEEAALDLLHLRKSDRTLATNVEFYTALLLEALEIPRDLFTCVFAMGRTAGWIAHAREQVLTGRLIRPNSVYVGPSPSSASVEDQRPPVSPTSKSLKISESSSSPI